MFTIKVKADSFFKYINRLESQQLPYATMVALRSIGNEAQKAEQDRLVKQFKLRRETWNVRGIKIAKEDRPTKEKLRIIIQVSEQTEYLNKFEEAGIKQPIGGRHYLWIPNDKVFRNKIISADDQRRPRKLALHKDAHGRIIGDQRSFMIRASNGEVMVLQRTGTNGRAGFKKGSIKALTLDNFSGGAGPHQRLEKQMLVSRKRRYQDQETIKLYTLKTKVSVPVKLEFVSTIQRTVLASWDSRMREGMQQALRTAR